MLFQALDRRLHILYKAGLRKIPVLGRAMDQTMRDESLAAGVGLDGPTVATLWSAFQNNVPGLYWTRVWAV